jgi:hypothetical protein
MKSAFVVFIDAHHMGSVGGCQASDVAQAMGKSKIGWFGRNENQAADDGDFRVSRSTG